VPRLVAPHLSEDALRDVAQPALSADGLLLRPWNQEDAPFIQDAFSAPDLQRWHFLRIDEPAEAERWIDAWLQRWEAGTDAGWAICQVRQATHVENGTSAPAVSHPVGYVGLREINLGAGAAQVSYWLVPSARGEGIAARAAAAVSDWALSELGLHRVWLMHSTSNPASCAVARRAGFLPEGTLREHLRHADGWHDMHIHGRLAQDRSSA